jgi:predicted transcriptional regulator
MRGDSRTAEIKKALEVAILSSPGNVDSSSIIDTVMSTLDKQKLLRYHNDGEISLISTPGRVLISLLEDPTMTQRALSVYLDLSETMIDKTLKSLISRGLITKTKLNRQNIYKVNTNEVKNHPDIHHLSSVMTAINQPKYEKKQQQEVVDDAPF